MTTALTAQEIRAWQRERLKTLLEMSPVSIGPSSVTIAVYHFWADEVFDAEFDYIEMAIRETWQQFGLIKTVMIVNHASPRIERFHNQFPDWTRIDVCTDLKSGNLYTMSRDCIGMLHQRVDTDYIMYVHPDGWALRPGLEEFLGKYDCIAAPWEIPARKHWVDKTLLRYGSDVGCGGFSLRSRKLFEIGAWYYRRRYKLIPDCFLIYEDIYFTKLLPTIERLYRDVIRFAPLQTATEFSLNDNVALYEKTKTKPLGFHSYRAFSRLANDGHIDYPFGQRQEVL